MPYEEQQAQRPGAVKSLANGELKDGQRPSQVSKEGGMGWER